MEIISMVLMCLGATNFVLHTFLFRGKWKQFFKDIEIKLAIFVIIFFTFATAVSSMYLYTDGQLSFAQSLRYSAFNVVSSISTTGFINAPSINALGEVAVFCGILLMGIGGGVGSTAGGIKQYRLGILFKDFIYSIRYRFSSSRTINPNPVYRLGELKEEDPGTSDEAHNYAVLYIVVFLVGSLVLAYLPAVKFDQAIYDFMSALSGTGLDVINFTNYKVAQALAYPWLLIVLDIGMIFGRLEILPIFYAMERVTVDSVENVKHNRNKAVKEA
jgi:trk system potassium uptake protein TrkH